MPRFFFADARPSPLSFRRGRGMRRHAKAMCSSDQSNRSPGSLRNLPCATEPDPQGHCSGQGWIILWECMQDLTARSTATLGKRRFARLLVRVIADVVAVEKVRSRSTQELDAICAANREDWTSTIDCTAISSQNASSSVAAATFSGTNRIEVVLLDHQSWLF